MEVNRQLIAPKGQGESEQDFERIVIDPAHDPKGQIPQSKPKDRAPKSLLNEQKCRFAKTRAMTSVASERKAYEHQKNDISNAVIEQTFAGNLGFQRCRKIGFLEHAQNGNRIGG